MKSKHLCGFGIPIRSLLPLFLGVFIIGCNTGTQTPESVARSYLEAATVGDRQVMEVLSLYPFGSSERIREDIEKLGGRQVKRLRLRVRQGGKAVVRAEFSSGPKFASLKLTYVDIRSETGEADVVRSVLDGVVGTGWKVTEVAYSSKSNEDTSSDGDNAAGAVIASLFLLIGFIGLVLLLYHLFHRRSSDDEDGGEFPPKQHNILDG